MATPRLIGACMLLVGFLAATAPAREIAYETAAQAAGQSVDTSGRPSAIEPQSDALLKRMAAYLTGLSAFTVRATNSLQVILLTGEKLDFEAVSDVTVRRPDRVRTRRSGVAGSGDFFYDGK